MISLLGYSFRKDARFWKKPQRARSEDVVVESCIMGCSTRA
jgi:hypothetical protein